MHPEKVQIAQSCLDAAHDGSMSFPDIVGALTGAGFEGYSVDYRLGSQAYYLASGESIALPMPHPAGTVAADFDSAGIERLVRWAQDGGDSYSYTAFSERAMAAGCAGYIVSFPGRRVVYYGRTGQTRIELFPD